MDITQKAMVVRFSVSQWTARKYDKGATQTVNEQYQVPVYGKDQVRVNKTIIAKDSLVAIQQVVNAARTYHYAATLPWKDDGARLLPAKNFSAYSESMRKFRSRFEPAVEALVDAYPDLIQDARSRLNGLFKPEDYPTIDAIRSKYSFDISISPVPTAGDFRVNLQQEEITKIREEISADTDKAVKAAHGDLYARLATAVGHMTEKLSDPKAIFRDSLVENVSELLSLIPRLDILDDPNLQSLCKQAEEKLLKYDPQTLRDHPANRASVATDAKGVLDALAGFYGAA